MFLGVLDPLLTNIIITRSTYVVIVFPKVYSNKRLLKGYSKSFIWVVGPSLDIINKLRVIGHLSKDWCPALSCGPTTSLKQPTLSRSLRFGPTRQWILVDLGYASPLFLKGDLKAWVVGLSMSQCPWIPITIIFQQINIQSKREK